MRLITPFLVMLPLLAYAGGDYGQAWEYHFQGSNCYAVVFTTQIRAYLELRTYDGKVIESLDFYSPYKVPEFDVKDAVADDRLEFLIRTSAGGTGIGQTTLRIFAIQDDHLRDVGRFILDEQAASYPETNWFHTVQGSVDFPEKDQVVYRSTEVVTKNGICSTNTAVEVYQFDRTTLTFRKTEEKPQPAPPFYVAPRRK